MVSGIGREDRGISYMVDLETATPHFGELRWWFICPNENCNKMVVKLYQAPGADYFLCRKCSNLTYQSCRDSGKSNYIIDALEADTGLTSKEVKRTYKQLYR
jgi:hypothetical protein